jgi:hypothetical protein
MEVMQQQSNPCNIITDKYHTDLNAAASLPCLGGKQVVLFLQCRVSIFPLFSIVASFGGLPFALLCLQTELLQALFLLVNCRESSSLFGPLASCLAASVVVHWGGNRTIPWPLV